MSIKSKAITTRDESQGFMATVNRYPRLFGILAYLDVVYGNVSHLA